MISKVDLIRVYIYACIAEFSIRKITEHLGNRDGFSTTGKIKHFNDLS